MNIILFSLHCVSSLLRKAFVIIILETISFIISWFTDTWCPSCRTVGVLRSPRFCSRRSTSRIRSRNCTCQWIGTGSWTVGKPLWAFASSKWRAFNDTCRVSSFRRTSRSPAWYFIFHKTNATMECSYLFIFCLFMQANTNQIAWLYAWLLNEPIGFQKHLKS